MAENGVKTYQIKINGVQESINAVDSLNKQLDNLEKRMNALNSKGVNVKTQGNSDLDAQEKLEKQILATEEKLAQVRDENYKKLLHMKEELKEYTQIAKSQVAAESNAQGLYDTNTMAGMKASLKSIKAEMQMVEVGGDRFKELTQQANELNNKLKDIEQSYGQFGRNVGNYAEGVAEGMTKVKIQVGDTVREFSNAREASRTLGNELKSMSINGEQGTKAFKDMQKAVAQLNSDIKDATVSSKAMDNLLDTMQSFAALGQVGQGISALFGFDNDEIERSIQKLVALQNVMQGIEKINQQINSQEGIGGWLAKGNSMIDDFVSKLTGANKAQEALNASTTAGVTASKSLAAAEGAQAVATNAATVATKALSFALKTIGIGLVIAAVAALIEYWEDIYDWFVDTIPALKNLGSWFEKIERIVTGVGNAILNYMVQPLATLAKVIKATIEGNFSEIPQIISSGLKKTFNIVGNFQAGYNKATENQQKRHNKKMLKEQREANDEWLKDQEAKYGKSYQTTKKYLDKEMALIDKQLASEREGSTKYKELQKEKKEIQRKMWENERTERERQQKQAEKDRKKALEADKKNAEAVKELYELQISLMKDGLDKILAQLEEERRQKLQKIQSDGVMVGKLTEATNALYDQKILEAKEEWAANIRKVYTDMWSSIYDLNHKNAELLYDNQIQEMQNEKESIEEEAKSLLGDTYSIYIKGDRDYTKKINNEFKTRLKNRKEYYKKIEKVRTDYEDAEYEAYVTKSAENMNHELRTLKNGYAEQDKALKDHLKKGEITQAQYNEAIKRLEQERTLNEQYIKDKYYLEDEAKEKEHLNRLKKIRVEAIASEINEIDIQLNNLGKASGNIGRNASMNGIINYKKFKEDAMNSMKGYDDLMNKLYNIKEDLENKRGSLDPVDYQAQKERLNQQIEQTTSAMQELSERMKEEKEKQMVLLAQYTVESITSIMDSIATIQANMYQAQIDNQEKYIQKYQELLDKQRDITQEHASEVDSIENELSNARGARREHLIDLLNAEMAAQRASLAEEKKIEKEQEKAEQKKKKLEHDQAVAQKKMSMAQAAINAAMAITFAAKNNWPIPALPMIALATAVGAAQMAAIASQKIPSYGDGGVIVGKSHKEGGVPVLGGRAEVEGNEFITNKKTTAQNTDLLYYINSKKRKLDLSDFIDFYGSNGAVRKNIQTVRTKFADGGQIPLLRNDIDVNSSLLQAMENYSNRPQVVQVVDIVNKMDSYRNTQVLAGLTPSF